MHAICCVRCVRYLYRALERTQTPRSFLQNINRCRATGNVEGRGYTVSVYGIITFQRSFPIEFARAPWQIGFHG